MKKSEKLKGKAAVANRKKRYTQYAVLAGVIVIVLLIAGFFLSGPSGAKKGDTVMVYYTGTLDNGTEFDSNIDRDPLIFTIGNNTVIPGFEEAVTGMTVNTTKTVHIPVEKAYGPHLDSLVHVVNRSNLPANMVPEAGKFYTITRDSDGAVARVQVINVTKDAVTLDENHKLTGQNLTFTITFAGYYQG
jgi:peptidylprolyl isomerase